MLCVDLATLKEGTVCATVTPASEELDLDPHQFSGLRVAVTLARSEDQVAVTIEVEARAVLVCDRTLVTFEQPIEGTHHLLLVASAGKPPTDYPEEVIILEPTQRRIDLKETVRDTLLLAVPIRKVAPGAEDVEIPTTFGLPEGEGTVDRRWDVLRVLREETPSSLS